MTGLKSYIKVCLVNKGCCVQHSNFEEGLPNIYIDMCWDLLILFYVLSNSDIYILKNISKHNNHIY